MRVLILGAGFGGLELATILANEAGDTVEVTLVDRAEGFVFGFSKLDVMFGRTTADHVLHRYTDLAPDGVRFVATTVRAIDPETRRVETDAGPLDCDVLVIALGADLHPDATPGLVEHGHEFYTVAGAFGLHDVLDTFPGGNVVVAVTSTPFKCPPAPSETALLLHDHLRARGLLDRSTVSLVMPLGVPIPPSPEASAVLLAEFERRGIAWHPGRLVRSVEPGSAVLDDGSAIPFDLLLAVPTHRAPGVVVESGLAVDGWIPVDPLTLRTRFEDVYAVGDVTSVGTPKAGVFAEGQATVVAAQLVARARGEASSATYDGRGICYLEMGEEQVAKVDVTFVSGQPPVGTLQGPSTDLAHDKETFGAERVSRWFGREWTP
ncbi:flavoprotein reductase [Nocardioides sp. Root1257]|uniref:NAD(P)/FAD-dependent oxidoreductase n=1 Tax=unclassified Nocardioides TaxID=2615069 RepID=UPI0006FC1C7F|nr:MULTISPECIES: FAD/NAD(P)-binding oxidoreductase [unclassified Nocardioides]KQW53035.1 flavoprotein reductase [Nocardioides sp. Root1257]KRC55723.1 flavoprotein reductase [Nocardioides sp. Root224]